MNIYNTLINYDIFDEFDIEVLRKNFILPIKKDGIYLECFICENSNLDEVSKIYVIKTYDIDSSLIEFFLSDIKTRKKLFSLSSSLIQQQNSTKQINEFFELFLFKAIASRSSDIHIEAYENSMIIRFRIDGLLKIFYIFDKEFFYILSSYIKMKSKLDMTNTRLPQDGRFTSCIENKNYDFRVSCLPTINAESIVLRILDNKNVKKSFDTLGFSSHILESINNIFRLKEGLVLITGPTGSGKSTTLYSLIKEFNSEDKKIITIEDPIEYKIQQIQQIQVNENIGLSFNTILKNILRQDPDIILIGEIRDEFSLNIALQASLTGHLVLASIHANSSVETVSRLIDLKADKYLLATTLKYVLSQRLVLNICKECLSKGCKKCNFTGFYNRSCISEILEIDEEISSLILNENYIKNIKEHLDMISFKNMKDDGEIKVKSGITSLEEIYKVLSF